MQDTVFLDIGGVFLTNGWDRAARRRTVSRFQIDEDAFEQRHRAIVDDFETGRMGLDAYLDCTIFSRPRAFGREEVTQFVFAQSQPYPEALSVLAELARSGRYFLTALNNESRELNQHRIDRYGLGDHFRVFLSSCYLGVRKPDPRIYRLALDIAQRRAGDCIFVDDREANVEAARGLGMNPVHYRSVDDLRRLLNGK